MAMTFWRLRDNRDAEICRWNQSPSKLLIIRRPLLRFLEAIRECPIRVMHLPVQCNISHCVAHPKKIRTHPASAGRTLTIFSLSFGYTRLNNTADPSNNPKRLCNWTPFASLFDQGGGILSTAYNLLPHSQPSTGDQFLLQLECLPLLIVLAIPVA